MEVTTQIQLPPSWLVLLKDEFEKPYMLSLKSKLLEDKQAGKIVYPPGTQIFNAFHLTPFETLKVVILGQDPYHGPGQAHGLCFSVPDDMPLPPSLQNIFKELKDDLGIQKSNEDGNLEGWAKQGVFLLNTTLTVCKGQAMSHKDIGWEQFTDQVIRVINDNKDQVIFILWGSHAQSKAPLISDSHRIIRSPHPSPLSAHRGFFGSKPFSKTNNYLSEKIDW